MATGFSTRSGPDGYRLNFDTDNLDYYLLMQKIARHFVDGKPAADVASVRHGRWFFTEYEFFTCSVCGESYYNGAESTAQAESYLNSGHTYKYCPNCGARMDKEDDHEAG